jgi:hypothetical protein
MKKIIEQLEKAVEFLVTGSYSSGIDCVDKAIAELKRIEDIKTIGQDLLILLEYEWLQSGNGIPGTAEETYIKACTVLRQLPKFTL